jgi:hypothetical protein
VLLCRDAFGKTLDKISEFGKMFSEEGFSVM